MDAHLDPSNTLAHPHYSHNEHVTHYSASDPHLVGEIGSSGATAGPSAGTAYIPPPRLGNMPLAPEGISPIHPTFSYIRQDIQHPVVSVDIYPEQNIAGDWATRSPSTPLTPRSPRLESLDPASAETASRFSHGNATD